MGLFRRKQPTMTIPTIPTIEVVAHKRAAKHEIEEVKRANESLQKVLDANHFTIKIYLAGGGKVAPNRKRKPKG